MGIASGSGVPKRFVDRIIGVVKAYSTRVGGGPFPTELDNEPGQYLRDRGNEYGTVTRRPRLRLARRGGAPLHGPAERRRRDRGDAARRALSGLDGNKDLHRLRNGRQARSSTFPSHVDDFRHVQPVYETLPGWTEEITACRTMEELPANARAYLDRISELVGRPMEMVSVGPERDQTICSSKLVKTHDGQRLAPSPIADVPPERRPRAHCDHHGRQRPLGPPAELPRVAGHQRGVDSVRRTTEECARLEIEQLTLYCLSSENWKRPRSEINFLMTCWSST